MLVGVLTGTDEYVLERAMEVVRDGGADRLARCLANMPDKQATALIVITPLRQRTSHLERYLDTRLSLQVPVPRSMQKGRQRGAVGARKNLRPEAAEAQSFFLEGLSLIHI